MSDLYIYETRSIVKDANGLTAQVPNAPITTQKVASGATTARSAAFNSLTSIVLLKADADVHIEFGDDSVDATANSFYLASGETLAFGIGDNTHVAVIDK